MTINSEWLAERIAERPFSIVAGVPDSMLSSLVSELESRMPKGVFFTTANEGNAVALAAGSYFATGEPGLVFMQNSGLGNAYNPLSSLTSSAVSGVPCVLLIGWRGEILNNGVQVVDEPQHTFQGVITCGTLDLLEIPWKVLPENQEEALTCIVQSAEKSKIESKPVAILVRKDSFQVTASEQECAQAHEAFGEPTRKDYINALLQIKPEGIPIIATTGFTSRELLACSDSANYSKNSDYLMVGSMGHAASIATGVAAHFQGTKVVCLDGDGAVLMHTGSLSTAAKNEKIIHIVLNNGMHQSVGGQATAFSECNFSELGKVFGYGNSVRITSIHDFCSALQEALVSKQSWLLDCVTSKIKVGDLPRPTMSPSQMTQGFMTFLKGKSF